MEIIKSAPAGIEENKIELYKLVRGPAVTVHKSKGDRFRVKAYMLYAEQRDDGEERKVLSIMSEDGVIYRTISQTFIRSFTDIVENFVEFPEIELMDGQSKAGRTFVDCVLVG